MSTDPYATLGLNRNASDKEIKQAYRKLVKELHPDIRPGDKQAERRFKQVSAAFDLLGDTEKRRQFDRGKIDADGKQKSPFAAGQEFRTGFSGHSTNKSSFAHDGFENLFDSLFSRNQSDRANRRGQDLKYRLNIGFIEAVNGAKRQITVETGRNIDLSIPAGVRDGQTLRLKGQGHHGSPGAPPGDCLILINIEPHPVFTRDGDNLRMDLHIALSDAVLGAKVQASTPSGKVSLSVPPFSSSGDILRLKGKGVQRPGKPGDLLACLMIDLPDQPDPELAASLRRWAEKNGK